MALFSDSIDGSLSWKKIFFFSLYVLFLGTSVWLTANSINQSFGLHIVISFIVGFGALAVASVGVAWIKKAFDFNIMVDNRVIKIVAGFLVLIIAWTVSLTSNTHTLYYDDVIAETQKSEIQVTKTTVEQLEDRTKTFIKNAKASFKKEIDTEVQNLKAEIINSGNPGLGPKSREIIKRVEKLLGATITLLSTSSSSSARSVANDMEKKINKLSKITLTEIDEREKNIHSYFVKNSNEYQKAIKELTNADENFKKIAIDDRNEVLENAYGVYNKHFKYIEDQFDMPFLKARTKFKEKIKKLDYSPKSVQFKNIITTWTYYFQDKFEKGDNRFLWNIYFALFIDFAAFIFFFLFVPNEEGYN